MSLGFRVWGISQQGGIAEAIRRVDVAAPVAWKGP